MDFLQKVKLIPSFVWVPVFMLLFSACEESGSGEDKSGLRNDSQVQITDSQVVDAEDAANVEECVIRTGRYSASYTKVSGNCDDFEPPSVPIEYKGGSIMTYQHLDTLPGYDSVATEVTFQDCMLSIRQSGEHNDIKTFELTGEFEIDSETELSGEMDLIEFDSEEAVVCNGKYEVVLVDQQ